MNAEIPTVPDRQLRPAHDLRTQVRAFLAAELAAGAFTPRCDNWLSGWDESFSRKLGDRGWIGITVPMSYGGAGGSALARYVVIEELLAAGAPVAAHWFADRQIAPGLLKYGSEPLKRRYLPAIVRGEMSFAIGLSEPEAGSDLAAVQTQARRTAGGFTLHGRKVWSSGAHRADAIVVLARSEPLNGSKHEGLTQLIVELPHPSVHVSPIISMSGEHHFNEVLFDGAYAPDEMVLGEPGAGWSQVVRELAFERSGPERILSTFPLFAAALDHVRRSPGGPPAGAAVRIGGLLSTYWALRRMSIAVAEALDAGRVPDVEAALVKELGTRFEADVVSHVRELTRTCPDPGGTGLASMLADALAHSPNFTLRGGTNEVLRGVIARGLGLR